MKTITDFKAAFCLKAAFFILLTLSTVTLLQAQTVTFGQFVQRNGSQDFVFTNNATGASFQTITDGSAILFIYQNVANLPAELQGPQLAHITVTGVTATPAFQIPADPPRDVQPFDQTIYIRIIRDTPAQSGTGTRRNLLTAIITPDGTAKASLSGDDQSDAVAFTASTARQNIQYTSDFLGFPQTNQTDNLGLSFSSVFPLLSIGPGGFFNSFTAAGSGTFAANPVPVFNPPTAAGVTISGRVFSANGTGVTRAIVTLTDSSGASRTASTNNLGYFRFTDIPTGQIVTISVSAKSANYQPQVFNLNDNIDEISFYPAQ